MNCIIDHIAIMELPNLDMNRKALYLRLHNAALEFYSNHAVWHWFHVTMDLVKNYGLTAAEKDRIAKVLIQLKENPNMIPEGIT